MGWSYARRVPARTVRHATIMLVDALVVVVAVHVALSMRFDGEVPSHYEEVVGFLLPVLVAVRVACNAGMRLHCWSFRMAGLPDAVRLSAATLAGTVIFVPLSRQLVPGGLPRTIYALEFFLTTTTIGALRFGPRVVLRWWGERLRRRSGAARTLIVGVNPAAELLARDVVRSPRSRYDLVGFVGDDARMIGRRLDGKPIVGLVRHLPGIIARHGVTAVLLAEPEASAARIREILGMCSNSRVQFKIIPPSFTSVDDRLSAAMLNDVAPEDLLPRAGVVFDQAEIASKVRGRRAMVTGAGGSIGGEMCRQLVRYGVEQLVMVDMNENELYLSARRLAEETPGVDIRAEVADVREPDRIQRLGARFRPQYVFHAAAHKHVPLMEEAPEEAVKNNVFGTLNVARMADACDAERFVLISTDKAVNPTSVMGATKRVAELVVRQLARTSRTRITAVRFGNVLGSAGSVVPIFKQQIERGGPVTVTHPECARFFMTIPEAVGLVLVAGLGDYGDLCVLDMGEPIRIADLARIMISLSGHVPGDDVKIVFTGLRPGEKLTEQVLTEEEEHTQAVRDRIRTARSPAPPADLELRLVELRRSAELGDASGVQRVLKSLVPTYKATPGTVTPLPSPAAAREGSAERLNGRAHSAAEARGLVAPPGAPA